MRISARRRELYDRLVNEHAAELYRFAVRLCGRRDVAEDLLQETFYEAWKSITSLRDPSRSRAWIYQILRHCYSHWRRKTSSRSQETVSLQDWDASPAEILEWGSPSLGEEEMLQKALERLHESYRETFLMVYLAGFTCQEAAQVLKIPLGTVLSRIHRARMFLRQFLKSSFPQADTAKDRSRISTKKSAES